MKIAILSAVNNFHCQKWANALVKSGAKVVVFSLDRLNKVERVENFETVWIPPLVRWNGRYRYPSYVFSVPRLKRELINHKIEILHPLHITPFGTWARFTGFQPCIMAAMGADILEYVEKSPYISWDNIEGKTDIGLLGILKKNYFRFQVKKALQFASLIVADNKTLVDSIINEFHIQEQKIVLLRWGVDTELFNFTNTEVEALCRKLNIPSCGKIILSPRGAKAFYQTDIIIEAFAKVLTNNISPHYFVVLASEYEVASKISIQARNLEIKESKFRFINQKLTRNEMAILWKMTDMFISAPLYDGYSASVAEGRYVGAIPLLNNIPGNREVIKNEYNGFIVDPFLPDQIAEKIIYILNNLSNIKPLFEQRNQKWIQENSLLEDNAKEFMEISYKLLNRYSRKNL